MTLKPAYDEMHAPDGSVRPQYAPFARWLAETSPEKIAQNRQAADLLFHRVGITFAVYGESSGSERLIPFDIVPHVIPGRKWEDIAAGLRQRIRALNAFLQDVYHGQEILKAGMVPTEMVLQNSQFRPEMMHVDVPGGIYAHIAGIDLVKDADGEYYVLEDNLRTPSGVSYLLENRKMMMRLFPELFAAQRIRPVDHYPDLLLDTLRNAAPAGVDDPTIVLMTPGHFNSAYFEHAFLAQQMGVELVEGIDLFVQDSTVFMRTTQGPKKVDVIYRRIDDDFIDPQAFRPDSMLGVPGLMKAYRAGRVALANAVGTGIADDKSLYPFVPQMIRFYLGEEPILRNVHTWMLGRKEDLDYVLAHLDELVVKEAQGSGGYGMLVGPTASREERERYRQRVLDAPERFIAQPTLSLSTCPTFADQGLAPRHIDLRPYVLSGRSINFVPGGLTRVALRAGSLVVNSSQGGGVKDTWVVD
ncbi:MAG TPA: circularly permuted type 2 ATP-grasp protein [Usitatibacteraceae bacterium]|nr:circularly permuted type 2 ATP-grasp protein [Usitatibacteraceae bacterium]